MKRWKILSQRKKNDDIISLILKNRGITTKKQKAVFLNPPDPHEFKAKDVGISESEIKKAIKRVIKAINNKESIVVYSDYDADGITGSAILWEVLYSLDANAMPYVPHRISEGYGFSKKGIDNVKEKFNPALIISIDHGVTASKKIEYARSLGIEVIVTDHHTLSSNQGQTLEDDGLTLDEVAFALIHTTKLSGSGVAWFFAKELYNQCRAFMNFQGTAFSREYLALAAIGTIADLVPLTDCNRSIVKYGLEILNKTKRPGILSLLKEIGIEQGQIETYHISYMLAPRINAVGRLTHAIEALRLLCERNEDKSRALAKQLGDINRERQQVLQSALVHARKYYKDQTLSKKGLTLSSPKLIFIAHESYHEGVIGLVAGRLVEEYYLPSIVLSKGEKYSKASARSISGFNIVDAIRKASNLLVDVGGHPMAAGFTVETEKLEELEKALQEITAQDLGDDLLTPVMRIDCEINFDEITYELYKSIANLAPFGVGNPKPVFAARGVKVEDARLVGREKNHLKLKLFQSSNQQSTINNQISAIGFRMGDLYEKLSPDKPIDIAFTIDENTWNNKTSLDLKVRDVKKNGN